MRLQPFEFKSTKYISKPFFRINAEEGSNLNLEVILFNGLSFYNDINWFSEYMHEGCLILFRI